MHKEFNVFPLKENSYSSYVPNCDQYVCFKPHTHTHTHSLNTHDFHMPVLISPLVIEECTVLESSFSLVIHITWKFSVTIQKCSATI
jgi:hypothetical protein